jgi:gliding-associated putative ABC transporter substrate-binding component GldG
MNKINIKIKQKYVLVIFSIITVVLINLIFYFGFFRFDFTKGKIYSLSKPSKKLVSSLDEPVYIRAVFSKVLPEQFKFIRIYVEDLLKEYRQSSNGKIKFEFIDPLQPNAKLSQQEVQSMGIIPIEFSVVEKDKFEVKKGYMGLALLYKDKKEVIPVISDIEMLEYDITSAIKKLTIKQKKVLGIVDVHKCDTLYSEEYTEFRQQIQKLYDIKQVDISSTSLNQTDALLVISPKENFDNKELFFLDQYILSGKPCAFLIDKYNINLQTFWATKINSNIFDFISQYGVEFFTDGLIADYQCQKVSLRTQQGFFVMENIVDYPFMPVITNLEKKHPLTKNMAQVVLPFVAPLRIKPALKDVSYTILMQTSKYSFLKEDIFSINPLTIDFRPDKSLQKGPFIVAVELKGKFTSYFSDDGKFNKLKISIPERIKEAKVDNRVLVFSSGFFVKKETTLLGNIIDYLLQEYELVSIRSKNVVPSAIKAVPDIIKVLYRYFIMFFPPAVVIILGILRWYFRKIKTVSL